MFVGDCVCGHRTGRLDRPFAVTIGVRRHALSHIVSAGNVSPSQPRAAAAGDFDAAAADARAEHAADSRAELAADARAQPIADRYPITDGYPVATADSAHGCHA